jgi:hypothetical protein
VYINKSSKNSKVDSASGVCSPQTTEVRGLLIDHAVAEMGRSAGVLVSRFVRRLLDARVPGAKADY